MIAGVSPMDVDQLMRRLRSTDERSRRDAIARISAIGAPAIGPLCEFLRTETWDVKPAAAEALGRIARGTHCCALREALPLLRRELWKVRLWLMEKETMHGGLFEQERAAELRVTQSTIETYQAAIVEIEHATAAQAQIPLMAQAAVQVATELPTPSEAGSPHRSE